MDNSSLFQKTVVSKTDETQQQIQSKAPTVTYNRRSGAPLNSLRQTERHEHKK